MKKLFNISASHATELYTRGLSVEVAFYLDLLDRGIDIYSLEDYKIKGVILTLERKNLVKDGKVTAIGRGVLDFLQTKGQKMKLVKSKDDDFDRWWKIFPSTNNFTYKGKSFEGARSMKTKELECRAVFNKYINTGIFTSNDIIEATKFHIEKAKELSITKKENQLTYISNSYTYLLNKKFEGFIEMSKKNGKSTEEGQKGEFTNIYI